VHVSYKNNIKVANNGDLNSLSVGSNVGIDAHIHAKPYYSHSRGCVVQPKVANALKDRMMDVT